MTMHRSIALMACMTASACQTEDDGDSSDTLTECHPLAGTAAGPARSQRATAPPTDAVAYVPPTARPYEGALSPNNLLEEAEPFGEALLSRAEDIAFDEHGRLYTGSDDGNIWRASIDSDGDISDFELFAAVGQHALGLAFDPCRNLVAAVPNRGLVAISPEGEIRLLADRVDGTRIEFADELAIARSGTIYFTEATTKYDRAWPYEILEGRPHGRLLAYEPTSGEVRVLLDDELYFPNGIVLAEDESHVLVAESLRARIRRHWLAGPDAGASESFVENLPVFVDNISAAADGHLWVTGLRRTAELDQLSASLDARMALLRMTPDELAALAPSDPYRLVVVVDGLGELVRSLHGPSGRLIPLSSAIVRDDYLYLGTNEGNGIARVALSPAP